MIKATYESANFTFTAYGKTAAEAINVLKKGLDQHTIDYNLDADWWHAYESDIYAEQIKSGEAYRDSELLKVGV